MAWEWTDVAKARKNMYRVTATESVSKETISFLVDEADISSAKNKEILQDRVNELDKMSKKTDTLLTTIKADVVIDKLVAVI